MFEPCVYRTSPGGYRSYHFSFDKWIQVQGCLRRFCWSLWRVWPVLLFFGIMDFSPRHVLWVWVYHSWGYDQSIFSNFFWWWWWLVSVQSPTRAPGLIFRLDSKYGICAIQTVCVPHTEYKYTFNNLHSIDFNVVCHHPLGVLVIDLTPIVLHL